MKKTKTYMNKLIIQINQKVQAKLKDKFKETPEDWYRRGVKENMKFQDWLKPLIKK